MSAKRKPVEEQKILKLDLGCGKRPLDGFIGVDSRNFGQPIVADLRKKWPWADGSVEAVHCSHLVEHLDAVERVHFVNELYRVLKPVATATINVPHWASPRAYGDLTHKWPPVSEWWFLYLNKAWREVNAPHSDYKPDVNFDVTYGYSLRTDIVNRSEDFRQYAMAYYKGVCEDILSTWVKR